MLLTRIEVDFNALDQVPGVIKAQVKSGQLQVIIGAKVAQVFEEASKLVTLSEDQVQSTEIKKNIIARVVEAISGCFGPVIPVLKKIGCQVCNKKLSHQFVAAILTTLNLVDPTSGTYQIISLIETFCSTFSTGGQILLAVSAAKKKASKHMSF